MSTYDELQTNKLQAVTKQSKNVVQLWKCCCLDYCCQAANCHSDIADVDVDVDVGADVEVDDDVDLFPDFFNPLRSHDWHIL